MCCCVIILGFRIRRVKRDPITKTLLTVHLSVRLLPGFISQIMIVRQLNENVGDTE